MPSGGVHPITGKTTTLVAGLRPEGIAAPFVLDGPINPDAFQAYIGQVLLTGPPPGDVVVVNNPATHQGPAVRQAIEAAPPAFSTFRPTVPTSTRSRTPSPSSRPSCAQPRAKHPRALGQDRHPPRHLHAR